MKAADLKVGQVFESRARGIWKEIIKISLVDHEKEGIQFETIITDVRYSLEDDGSVAYPYRGLTRAFKLINS